MAVAYHQVQFPPGALDWPQLLPLIGPANAAVARYEGVLHGIPNPNVLLSPLTSQEAVLSSRIEGTQASRPIFAASDFVSQADIPEPTAKRILRLVRDSGLLREIRASRGRRLAVLAFPELLNICEGRDAF